MASKHLNDILGKLNEVRAVFVLGQRAVPFMEEMFAFLKEISPLMDEINASIRESTHKMPHATSKLHSVTQATEMATTEILDLVDEARGHIEGLKARITEYAHCADAIARTDSQMIRLLRARLQATEPALLAQLEAMHEEKKEHRRVISKTIRQDVAVFDVIRDELNRIMMALQVQDITAQQLAAANHLIESIRTRLNELIARLGDDQFQSPREALPPIRLDVAFDPNAQFDRTGKRQDMADQLVATFEQAEPASETQPPAASKVASQDDIDSLFGKKGAPADVENQPAASEQGDGVASQDDIDRLFGTLSKEIASQDDIDRLFQNGL